MFRRARTVAFLVVLAIAAIAGRSEAQTTTYHLHNEGSSTPGLKQLQTAGPDVASVAIQTANLKGAAIGEKLIKEFDTPAGVLGTIPSGSTVTFRMWIKKTASAGTIRPLFKLFLDGSSGTLLCSQTSTTAVGTSFGASPTTLTCNTSTAVTLVSTSRFDVWVGGNLTVANSMTDFALEVDVEGTLNGNFDSRVDIPNVRPAITSIVQPFGGIGQHVTINGTNFGSTGTVKFTSNKTATTGSWSDTSIDAIVPSGAIDGNVTVTAGGVTSLGVAFDVRPTPTITSLPQNFGGTGQVVTINGTNFKPMGAASVAVVTFNGVATTTFSTWTSSKIVTTVPAGVPLGAGPLIVTVDGVPSASTTFTVPPPPVIDALVPAQGGLSQSVVINGSHFNSSGTVMFSGFGGTPADISSWSDTSITAVVPFQDLGPVSVTVVTGAQTSNAATFTMLPTPAITSVSPSPAPVGATVTMGGTSLGATQGSSTLTFNGTPATTFESWSNTQIQAVVPAGASTGTIVVTVNGVPSHSATSLLVRPTLTSLSPPSAHVTDVITINGQSFGNTQGTGEKVFFNGTQATPTSWSDTSIQVPVPAGATSGDVVVQVLNSANVSNPVPFTVIPPPTVTSATPPAAHIGDAVTIGGTNFGATQGSSTIRFNGITATPTAWNDTHVTAPVPIGTTNGNIVVTVSGASSPGFPFTIIVPGTMSGTITRVTGGTAIAGALVQAFNQGAVKGSATTAANGTYTIANLDPGSYDVRVTATGFSSELTSGQTIVSLTTTTVNVAMSAPGSVGGRVTQADGVTPIAGAAVTVFSGSTQSGTANTNGTGDYVIGGLHPGSFTIQAANIGNATAEQGAVVTESATTTANFALQGAPAGPVRYAYDELNRLIQVTNAAGQSAIYRYDAVGNILAIERPGAGGVAIGNFAPKAGPISTVVTIAGTGFSPTPAQNTVTFGGAPATVTAATLTQIVATVPAGATTGSVAVTTPTGSATSTTAFTVTAGNAAPTITSFTPASGVPGAAVTISGTGFDTVLANDRTRFNVGYGAVASATPTTLATTVPANAGSGHITIATPNGTATSADDFIIPPPGFAVADVQVSGRIPFGTPTPVPVSTAEKIGLMLFDTSPGHRFSVVGTNGVTGQVLACDIFVTLLAPNTTMLTNPTCMEGSGFIDVVAAPLTGTYTLLVDPYPAVAGGVTLTLYDLPPDASETIAPGGSAVTVTATVPGQNGILTFSGTAGQRVAVLGTNGLSGYVLGCDVNVSVLKPDGSVLAPPTCMEMNGYIDTLTLPATGMYSIKVDPVGSAIGSVTLTLYDVPADVSGTITPGGSPVTVTTTVPGQNGLLTFSANAGDRVSLLGTNGMTGQIGLFCDVNVSILKPDGTALASPTCMEGSGFLDAVALPTAGTYTVKVDPTDYAAGSVTLTLYSVPADLSGTLTVGGSPVTFPITGPGQNASATFSGTASQQVTVHVTGNTIGMVVVKLLKPDGSLLTLTTQSGSSFDLSSQTLPTTGTYTIVIDPQGTATGSISVNVTNP